jgi:microcystin-dependent protein
LGFTNLGNPSGTIVAFAGSTAPNGYLIADGSAVSRTTYATLFAVIGTTYGTGDGSTTFNLPDLRGRTAVGLNTSEVGRTDVNTLGNNEGAAIGSRTPYHKATVVQPTISVTGNPTISVIQPTISVTGNPTISVTGEPTISVTQPTISVTGNPTISVTGNPTITVTQPTISQPSVVITDPGHYHTMDTSNVGGGSYPHFVADAGYNRQNYGPIITNSATTGITAALSGAPIASGGSATASGGSYSVSGGSYSASGGSATASGGSYSASGGTYSASGGSATASGGSYSASGGTVGPQTNVPTDTGAYLTVNYIIKY